MTTRSKTPLLDDLYCQLCSSSPSSTHHKRLSCFTCEHCNVPMCYSCFEKHTATLNDEHSPLTDLLHRKQQALLTFEEQCIRNVHSTFDEVLHDLENLRKESIEYVRQHFHDAEIVLSDMISNVKPLITQSQRNWTHQGITKNAMSELEAIEHRLDVLSSPKMQLKMSTFPRNKLQLHCQLLTSTLTSTKPFSSSYPGKLISSQCSSGQQQGFDNEKIDVDTEVEELDEHMSASKQTQTGMIRPDLKSEPNNCINTNDCLSTRHISRNTIFTQNEVDRLASDGEHLLYFSETSRSLCYLINIQAGQQTKEITCRWAHHPVLDLVYSSVSSQYICATKAGVYTCTIDSDHENSTIDIQLQLTQNWSYVRLAADAHFLWLWTDTPHVSQLRVYSPKTFDCLKLFSLSDRPRFSDNSTSFCIQSNLIATVFQFKQPIDTMICRKTYHVTLCDTRDLHELCTIELDECDIDHEIRSNKDGVFFLTNGQRKLWIIDSKGRKEYVKLNYIGRALTVYRNNRILIANGTQQLQCIELLQNDNGNM